MTHRPPTGLGDSPNHNLDYAMTSLLHSCGYLGLAETGIGDAVQRLADFQHSHVIDVWLALAALPP